MGIKKSTKLGKYIMKGRFKLLGAFCMLLVLLSSKAALAQPSGYDYYKDITLNSSQIQGAHTDFPVLISMTDTELRDNVENSSGYDIIFTNSDGSVVLDHRLELYTSGTGRLVAWVKVPSLSSASDTQIRMYYGNSSVTADQSSNNVWDSNYAMVQNLSGSYKDRTVNGNNGTNNGSGNIAGKIGNARSFNGTSQYISVPNSASLDMAANDEVTVSAWVWKDQQQTGWRAIVQKSDQSYNLQFNEGTNQPVFTIYDGGWNNVIAPSVIATNQWVYLTGTFDGSTIRLYVNGNQVGTAAASQISSSTVGVGIGENLDANGRYLDGRIDEVRISNIARSAAWIATEYSNQNNPGTFHTIGAQQATDQTPAGPPLLESATVDTTQLVLDYSEALNTNSVPETNDFSVLVNGNLRTVSNVLISTDKVVLTLNPGVMQGENVTLSYTADTSPIEDLAGNNAANLSDSPVNNNTISEVPTPPIEIEALAVAGGDIEISFEDVDTQIGIISYSVKRSSSQGSGYTEIGTVSDNESTAYTFTDNTASDGTTYYYVITSTDNNLDESEYSEEVFATADATSPVLQAISLNAETVTLDYNEALDLGSVPSAGDFTVQVNAATRSITDVSVNGPRVIITISPEAIAGDAVEVDYSPGSSPVRDAAGNNAFSFTGQSGANYTFSSSSYGPDPCPIVNGQDAAWACFSGSYNGTSMTANVGGLNIATITAATGSQTTFAPNALQQWASGAFSGDQFNGPQANPVGNSGNATSFDININMNVPSDALILSLNRLRPAAGGTSYTLEAFDGTGAKVTVNDWITGQGTDGGVCVNNVNLNYTNGNTTIEFQPSASGNPSCTSSSTPIWFRITDASVERIEIRKTTSSADNIHLGMALVADFGDAPATYGTSYSGSGTPPAFHLLNNGSANTVYFGAGVDADGNGVPGAQSNNDDTESSGLGSGDDEDAITVLPDFTTADTEYSTTLVCTSGGYVGGWVDFNKSGTFDANEYTSGVCASGSVNMTWNGLSGLTTGFTHARFRIASSLNNVLNPVGVAYDGEVEDYRVSIIPPPTPDLELTQTVSNSNPIQEEIVTFTLSLTNPGNYIASAIKVTDELPSGLTFVSAEASQGSYNSSTGLWNVGTMPATGDSATVTLEIEAMVNSGTLGNTIVNQASITSFNETDPELANNSSSAGITVVPKTIDMAVTMIVDEENPIEGQNITFTVTVTNNSANYATSNLTIIDQIPTGLSFESVSTNTGTYNSSTGIWDIGILSPGSNGSMTLNVSVDDETVGSTITNSAAINSIDQTDPNSDNNTASVELEVVVPGTPASCSDISNPVFNGNTLISGTAGQVGAIYLFEDVLTGVDAEVEIISINNAEVTNIDATANGGEVNNFQPEISVLDDTQDEGYIDFEFRFLQAGTQNPKFLTFTASGIDIDGSPIREFVGFQRLNSFTVEQTTNLIVDSYGIYTTFEGQGNLEVDGIDSDYTENLTYTTYTNEPQFRYRAGIKDPNSTGFRQFSLSFNPCIIENFDNPTSTNIVDLEIIKQVDENVPAEGDNVTFTIEVSNLQGNTIGNVLVEDELPSQLSFVSATPSQGTFDEVNEEWDIGNLSGFQSVTLTLVAQVNNNTAGENFTNTAVITDHTGTDGNVNNNQSSVNMAVDDPFSTSCSEPPLFSFDNYVFEQGVPGQVNAVYRYTNIGQGLDALVKIKAISNAILNDFDAEDLANADANFSPLFTATQSGGYIDWEIRFVSAGTFTPVKKNFAMTALDIDGYNNNGSIRDYLGFAQNQANIVEGGNRLNISTSGPFEIFESATTTDGNGTFDTRHMAYIVYNYTSVFEVRTGSFTTGGYQDDRLVDIDFTQCRNEDFDPQVVNPRNADLQVVKTVDQPNPLENETVNFTITVTNNGPEDATEVDINESLPQGLTLVQATPSQGTYNQITKIWSVGNILNNASATLDIEATVNSGITQDSLINKAFVNGFNQSDPNVANDTSKVVLKISVQIQGTIFEDRSGNGYSEDSNFSDASGDQQALENVEVHLFKDGGDGLADGSDDTYETTVTTSNLGKFVFQLGEDGDYWIAVDSRTGELSDGSTWGEQTYAPVGGYCEDATGAVQIRGAAGHCFGGRRGNQSDNISETPVASDLANAEHIAKVTVAGQGISNIDFGFSFNVVTNTDDDDEDGSASRSAQGSLRQFIINANAITGANSMRFIPVVPANSSGSGGSWWTVTLNSELPGITDPLTTIAGTAYSFTAPKTARDDNPGTTGSGGVVGIDNLSLDQFTRKEFEIDLNDVGSDALLFNTSGAFVLRNIAIFNNERAVRVQAGSSGLIERNLIGVRADGSNPGGGLRAGIGIDFNGLSSTSVLVQNNFVSNLTGSGIESSNSGASVTVYKNEISQTAQSGNLSGGIKGNGSWSIEQNLISGNGNSGSSGVSGGSGIELTGAGSGHIVRNNTIRDNVVAGITVFNGVTGALIEENIIHGNGTNYAGVSPKKGAGVKLTNPNSSAQQGVRITRNSFYNNHGISIDVVTGGSGEGDGVSPNDGALQSASAIPNRGLDYPVFTLSTLENNILHLEGFVGTNAVKIPGTFTIEVYKADDDGDNNGLVEAGGSLTRPHGEGRYLLGTISTNTDGTFSTDIDISGLSTTVTFNDRITAIAISGGNNTSEFSANARVVPTGVSISGYVYHDTNHNQIKDGTEAGISNVTMVLYNLQENNCKSVLTDSDGKYEFPNVLNGQYDLIESYGQSVPTPDVCTPAQTDPDDFVSTTPNLRTVTVNNLPAFQNFGDFEGVKISGTVFNDNGLSGGTANDALKNGGETNLAVPLQVLTSSGTLIEQITSPASGLYSLWVPKSVVPSGGTVRVKDSNGTERISTGGQPGTTGGSYNINTDETSFTITAGTVYTGVDFGNVQVSRFLNDGQQTTLPGAVATFQHQFQAKTAGEVLFTTNSVLNPTNPNWPVVLYRDANCNGEINSGEPILTGSNGITVAAGDNICLLLKVTVPYGLENGATATTTITADFDYANSAIEQILDRSDIVTVSTAEAGLVIIKAVDKTQALPGELLTYSIEYENLGDEPITEVEIIDEIPAFTSFTTSDCGTLPNGITNCSITNPQAGQRGTIKWTFTGSLQPGGSGTVSYTVTIDN